MTDYRESADAAFLYREGTAAEYAQMNSTAPYGNVAALMKDAIVITSRIIVNGVPVEWWFQPEQPRSPDTVD